MLDSQPKRMVTIKLEGNDKFEGFDCRGRTKNLCDGCRLRFSCLSERDVVTVTVTQIKRHKITDLKSLVTFMFGEGKISYELSEHSSPIYGGGVQTRFVMRMKDGKSTKR